MDKLLRITVNNDKYNYEYTPIYVKDQMFEGNDNSTPLIELLRYNLTRRLVRDNIDFLSKMGFKISFNDSLHVMKDIVFGEINMKIIGNEVEDPLFPNIRVNVHQYQHRIRE